MNINDYKNRHSFSTPDGYFEKLNLEIKEATCSATRPIKKNLSQRVIIFMSYAAMIAIIATISTTLIFNNHKSNNNISALYEEYDNSEFIDNMLSSYPIDEYTFYCYLTGTEQ